jgi:hypothetical protein
MVWLYRWQDLLALISRIAAWSGMGSIDIGVRKPKAGPAEMQEQDDIFAGKKLFRSG